MPLVDGEVNGHKVTFNRSGALHKARWVANLIYSIKICLFMQQIAELERNTVPTQQQVKKNYRLCEFDESDLQLLVDDL